MASFWKVNLATSGTLTTRCRPWAGYGTIGYIARQTTWTPSLSYRDAVFSGDDPDTDAFERWDPLLSTGLGI